MSDCQRYSAAGQCPAHMMRSSGLCLKGKGSQGLRRQFLGGCKSGWGGGYKSGWGRSPAVTQAVRHTDGLGMVCVCVVVVGGVLPLHLSIPSTTLYADASKDCYAPRCALAVLGRTVPPLPPPLEVPSIILFQPLWHPPPPHVHHAPPPKEVVGRVPDPVCPPPPPKPSPSKGLLCPYAFPQCRGRPAAPQGLPRGPRLPKTLARCPADSGRTQALGQSQSAQALQHHPAVGHERPLSTALRRA